MSNNNVKINKAIASQKNRTVILWGREDLLARAFEVFLTSRQDWEVIRFANTNSLQAFIQEVRRSKPDVAILYQGDCPTNSTLPMQLMHECPNLKVITVSLENNSMEVYSKKKVWLQEVADLLSVVES